jgi:uncharacterized repeat protein (TIGR01451 family)
MVEFALILPVFLLILVAAVDVGRLFLAYVTIENAAKEGALYGAMQPSCTSVKYCPDPNNTTWHVVQDLSGLSPATTAITVSCNGATMPIDGTTPPSCLNGQPYQVAVRYPFAFYTPLVSAIIGPSLSLGATASAVVMNSGAATSAPALSVYKSSSTTFITTVGQVIPYDYEISNTGNVSVSGITVVDSNPAIGTVCSGLSLGVGLSTNCDKNYTTTSADLATGNTSLTNTVTVTATSPSGMAPATAQLIIPIQGSGSCTNPTVTFTATPLTSSGVTSLNVAFTATVGLAGQQGTATWTWDDTTTSAPIASGPSPSSTWADSTHIYMRPNGTKHFQPHLTVTTGATCSTTYTAPNNYITMSP